MNIVVLQGSLSRPADFRELPSGDRLIGLEVTVPRPGEKAESVPVVWAGARAGATDLDVGDQVVVVGRVRRRFFTAAGVLQSRTEVVADAVVLSRRAKRARTVVAQALARAADFATTGTAARNGRAPAGTAASGQASDRNTIPVRGLG